MRTLSLWIPNEVHCVFSSTGLSLAIRYAVAVTRDQTGTGVLAQATADTTAEGHQETLSVDLDLHRATAGAYFLATTHEQDQAAYYYALQIK